MITAVHLVVTLGMLVIVPLGLGLLRVPGSVTARRLWWFGAVPGVVSLWLDRGPAPVILAGSGSSRPC